jgi:hypothetical protein
MKRLIVLVTTATSLVLLGSCGEPTHSDRAQLVRLGGSASVLELAEAGVLVQAVFRGQVLTADDPRWLVVGGGKAGGSVKPTICEVALTIPTEPGDAESKPDGLLTQPCGNSIGAPAGDYTLEVSWGDHVVVSEAVTLAPGQMLRRAVDVDRFASRIRGRALLNGVPVQREVCASAMGASREACQSTDPDGLFDFMVVAGSLMLNLEPGDLRAVELRPSAGEILDAGDVPFVAARLAASVIYNDQIVPKELLGFCDAHFSYQTSRVWFVPCQGALEYFQSAMFRLQFDWYTYSEIQEVTLAVGSDTRAIFDLSAQAGMLTTQLVLNGRNVTDRELCTHVSPDQVTRMQQCFKPSPTGTFTMFLPRGPVEIIVTVGRNVRTIPATVIAGKTTALPPIEVSAATAVPVVRFNGEVVTQHATCNAILSPDQALPVGIPCDRGPQLVEPGAYRLQTRFFDRELPEQTITFAVGDTRELTIDASSVAGMFVGRATINGQPLPQAAKICAYGGGSYGFEQPCTSPDGAGRYRLLVPAGTWFLSAGGLSSSIAYTVGAGQVVEVEPDPPAYTPPGDDVEVTPDDETTEEPSGVSLTFDNVSSGGETTVTTSGNGTPVQGFRLGSPPVYYEINTTASFTGPIKVCIDYSGQTFTNERNLRLMHDDGGGGGWQDVTLPGYPVLEKDIICGEVSSLSPFVIGEPNGAPVITGIALPAAPVALGASANITAAFSDANVADVHTATIDWEGFVSAGSVSEAGGSGTVSGSRAFSAPGVYTVSVSVSDGDQSATRSSALDVPAYIVVFDPSDGYVTGGGWITSPAGAYAPDASLAGKATFGFVSRYARGATTPSGKTEFHFAAGELRFRSDTYDWLVTAGARAQFKGVGQINGAGRYGFLLTAYDGQATSGDGVDKFRIKIWDITTGVVVYDNRMASAEDSDAATILGGGSITIHRQ